GEGGGEEGGLEIDLQRAAGIRQLAERLFDGGEDQGVEVRHDLRRGASLRLAGLSGSAGVAGDETERSVVQPAQAAEGLEPARRTGGRGDDGAAVEGDGAAAEIDAAAGAG